MSDPANPTLSNRPFSPADAKAGLMFIAAHKLMPLFQIGTVDTPSALQAAVSAIEAYRPETRADYVNIARTIAFSMAAVALLGQAAAADMAMPEKMRAYGRANALNRSAEQTERAMMQRRRYQQANPVAEPADPAPADQAADPPINESEMRTAIEEAMAEYRAACQSATIGAVAEAVPASTQAAPGTARSAAVTPALPASDTTALASSASAAAPFTAAPAPIAANLQPPPHRSGPIPPFATPPRTAIRHNGPNAEYQQGPPPSFRQKLLRTSSLEHVIDRGGESNHPSQRRTMPASQA